MNTFAFLSGRFHPVHRGHVDGFNQLSQKFGNNRTYLALSSKQEPPDSPFNVGDRAKMAMAAGIPKSNIISVTQPYSGKEFSNRLQSAGIDTSKCVLVFGVCEKDMQESPRFSFKPNKDGSPSYYQPYDENNIQPMSNHAYIITTKMANFPINGIDMSSGTEIRDAYSNADDSSRNRILQDLYGNNAANIKPIFEANLNINESFSNEKLLSFIKESKELIKTATPQQKIKLLGLIKEGFNKLKSSSTLIESNIETISIAEIQDYLDEHS